jgi:flavodoxin short chain
MGKIAVVYWSGTGNTGAMADKIAEGARAAGGSADVFTADGFSEGMMDDYDAVAFGCPSMGDEVLEDGEFEPMFEMCKPKLKGKKVALFGSYGWGDGEWMRNWKEDCAAAGADMPYGFVICNGAPDGDAAAECISLGGKMAS